MSTDWVPVLDQHPDSERTLPGYVRLDMPGKVGHILERDLEFRDTPPNQPKP